MTQIPLQLPPYVAENIPHTHTPKGQSSEATNSPHTKHPASAASTSQTMPQIVIEAATPSAHHTAVQSAPQPMQEVVQGNTPTLSAQQQRLPHQQQQSSAPSPPPPPPPPQHEQQGHHQQQSEPHHQQQQQPFFSPNEGVTYQQQMMTLCARGDHSYDTKYGMVGIIVAIACFPCGLLALLSDQKKICTR